MFHKATDLKFKEGTTFEMTFQDGTVKRYDISVLFDKYPQLKALEDRNLFTSGKMMGAYGIIWNDDLDIEAETVYEEGVTVRNVAPAEYNVGEAIQFARAARGITQKQLACETGINQADISKIERGIGNPTLETINRIASALDSKIQITLVPVNN